MEIYEKIKASLPHQPGVYIYKNAAGKILYIGKAKDLKKRVSQYFLRHDAVGEKTDRLVGQITEVKTIITDNEFDALLLESKLIRLHLPKYNVISRDDKSPLYIVITTNDPLPYILWKRKTELAAYPKAKVFGPFQSGRIVRSILRQLRSIIPYCTSAKRNGKPCFYTHLHLCDPCPSTPLTKEQTRLYRSNIRKIIAILSGESLLLLHLLQQEMHSFAAENKFEQANMLKKRIAGLHGLLARHFDPSVYLENELFSGNIRTQEAASLEATLGIKEIHRIECIDISNTGGTFSTGSLVVFIDGLARTSDYRRFKIRTKEVPNDVAMIAEVVRRRFTHTEWPLPDLLVIDGGKGQVRAAAAAPVPVIGLAKRFEEIIIGKKTYRFPLHDRGLQLLMRLRDESHRFARAYHRLLRAKAFLPN